MSFTTGMEKSPKETLCSKAKMRKNHLKPNFQLHVLDKSKMKRPLWQYICMVTGIWEQSLKTRSLVGDMTKSRNERILKKKHFFESMYV